MFYNTIPQINLLDKQIGGLVLIFPLMDLSGCSSLQTEVAWSWA